MRPTSASARRCLRVLLLALGPLVVACENEPARARPADGAMLWKTLGAWSGSGGRQTESFDVTSGSLRLIWEAAGEPDHGHLHVALHSSISGRPLETIVETTGPGADTVHLAAEPRVAYLMIESDRVGWRLTLQEGLR